MNRGAAFRQGIRAAIPVYLGFFSVTLAIGIAAQAAGLSLLEILWMSAAVFAAPAQFAAIELLPGGGHTGQILLSTLFINLRFA
ncbi:MAG: AzlC family ABC transporter permease, partial [Candidatus Methylomirabilales bacterium]